MTMTWGQAGAGAVLLTMAAVLMGGPASAQTAAAIFKEADLALGERLMKEHACSACHQRKVGGDGTAIYRPGGRIAGFTHQADELIPKRIELMRASDQ